MHNRSIPKPIPEKEPLELPIQVSVRVVVKDGATIDGVVLTVVSTLGGLVKVILCALPAF